MHSQEAALVVLPRATAVLSPSAETDPTQRDRHIQAIAEQGWMGWQKTSGYNARASSLSDWGFQSSVPVGGGRDGRTP